MMATSQNNKNQKMASKNNSELYFMQNLSSTSSSDSINENFCEYYDVPDDFHSNESEREKLLENNYTNDETDVDYDTIQTNESSLLLLQNDLDHNGTNFYEPLDSSSTDYSYTNSIHLKKSKDNGSLDFKYGSLIKTYSIDELNPLKEKKTVKSSKNISKTDKTVSQNQIEAEIQTKLQLVKYSPSELKLYKRKKLEIIERLKASVGEQEKIVFSLYQKPYNADIAMIRGGISVESLLSQSVDTIQPALSSIIETIPDKNINSKLIVANNFKSNIGKIESRLVFIKYRYDY
jgi:hypothetical protein